VGLVDFYREQVLDTGQQPAFLLLLTFLITFLLTRLYTRLARTRGWGSASAGDVHIHHLVVGIILLLLSGFLAFALDPGHPGVDILAILFGGGAALTLDEFALWFYLKDVYWASEGRKSIDAIIFGVLLGGLVVLGGAPLGISKDDSDLVLGITVAVNVVAATIAFLKGKFFLGVAGLFLPFLGWVAAIRLARPRSPWARWRYVGRREKKMAKAIARDRKRDARKTRVRDFLGGAHDLKSPQA
jgi:hypothetical protein